MKKTGRTLYLSGLVTKSDIITPRTGPADASQGFAPIWTNERKGHGYIVRFVGSFPNVFHRFNNSYLLTTYSERDLRKLNSTTAGINIAIALANINTGQVNPTSSNDRVIATYSGDDVREAPQRYANGIVKHDALVVQGLSLIVDLQDIAACNYYIEIEEVELTEDEMVLALLQESSQNTGNLVVR